MQVIPLSLAKPGMVLAKEIKREDGVVLCGKGTILTESILSKLERLNVGRVVVKGKPLKVEGEKGLKERIGDLEKRFSIHRGSEIMEIIKEAVKEAWLRESKEEEEENGEGDGSED